MAQTKQRLVDGPEADHLTIEEVAVHLRMSAKTVRRLVADGEFPRPIELSPKVKVWTWRDVLYWTLRAELRSRLRPTRKRKPGEGQGGTDPPHVGTNRKRDRPES